MTELCFIGGIACDQGPAHRVNIQSYNDQQRGVGGEILGMTWVGVDQRLVGFPDHLPASAGESEWP